MSISQPAIQYPMRTPACVAVAARRIRPLARIEGATLWRLFVSVSDAASAIGSAARPPALKQWPAVLPTAEYEPPRPADSTAKGMQLHSGPQNERKRWPQGIE